MNKDLTVGKTSKVLWIFCLPLFGSVLFQQLYNIADSFVAGHYIGHQALASVGNSYEITLIFLAFAFGCNVSSSVIVAQIFGSKRYGKMKTGILTAFLASGLICLLLMVFGLLFSKRLLLALQTPSTLMEDSLSYLRIYIFSLPFVFYYNLSTGIFSALGDSKTPFLFLVVSSMSNVLMDIFFVKYLKRGVTGLAEATLLCQGISCLLALYYLSKRLKKIKDQEKGEFFSWSIVRDLAKIAIPSTLQQSFISVGNLFIQAMVNSFGIHVMAGYAASVKLNNLLITSLTTFGNGVSSFSGQNLGAGKTDRIQEAFHAGLKLVWLIVLPIFLLYFFQGEKLLVFFIEDEAKEALAVGKEFLQILSPFYFVVSVKLLCDGILRGISKMKEFMIATFTDLILRVLLCYIFSRTGLASRGLWLGWPVGWLAGMVLSYYYFKTTKWSSYVYE